jgi:hypothetical protein
MGTRIEIGRTAWRYWAATALLLGLKAAGWAQALPAAVALTAVNLAHAAVRSGSLRAFPAQVRLAYLGILAFALWGPFDGMHWVPLAGTTASVLFGYCLLARTVALLPWNRHVPLTPALLRRAFLTPPAPGSVLGRLYGGDRPRAHPGSGAASLRTSPVAAAGPGPTC